MRKLETRDIYRIAVQASCDQRTVRRWLDDPQSVRDMTAFALEKARKDLGIEFVLPKTA